MRKDKKKMTRIVLAAGLFALLLVSAGGLYVNHKANQLLTAAAGDLVALLEPVEAQPEMNGSEILPSEAPTDQESEAAAPSQNGSGGFNQTSGSSDSDIKKASSKDPQTVVAINTEAITLAEKAKAYKLATSKLSASEMNQLLQQSKGGFTETERESAKSLFYSRFTPEEQAYILQLFKKYTLD